MTSEPFLWKQRSGTFVPLLASLIGMIVVSPIARNYPFAAPALISVLLITGIFPFLDRRAHLVVLCFGIAIALSMRWLAEFFGEEQPWLIVSGHATVTAFMLLLQSLVLSRVLSAKQVTTNTVIGAICAYLLIAYIFSFAYALVQDFDRGALTHTTRSGEDLGAQASALLYFSFVTLTTLGFGDIVPVSPAARMLVMLEVISGQLYLAAFVARLVGAMGPPERQSE
jgi:hypothetical protein